MGSDGRHLFDIAHVKVDFIALLKMYVIPTTLIEYFQKYRPPHAKKNPGPFFKNLMIFQIFENSPPQAKNLGGAQKKYLAITYE